MKFLKKIFSLNGRLNRKEYLFLGLLPMVGQFFLIFFIMPFLSHYNKNLLLYLVTFIFLLILTLMLISTVKRGRDSGLSGLVTLSLYVGVPISVLVLEEQLNINISYMAFSFIVYLLLKPSSPKGLMPNQTFEYVVIFIVVLVSFLWIYPFMNPLPPYGGVSKKDRVCLNMDGITQPLKMFKLDNGVYPSSKEGLEALLSNPDVLKYPNYASIAYLEYLPTDSWGTEIVYVKTKDGFELISYGADKKEGGEDEGADIFYSGCGK